MAQLYKRLGEIDWMSSGSYRTSENNIAPGTLLRTHCKNLHV